MRWEFKPARGREAIDHSVTLDAVRTDPSIVPARYWHALDDGRIQCDLCPRFCRLKDGQRGLCFIRARAGDAMVMTSYGRSSGYCIDPIEKKPLNHFLPGSPVLSFGTAGCNLACKFCQNWDISKSREIDTLADAAAPEVIVRAAQATGCRSVAFTYNDPIIFLEYALDIAAACREANIATVAVTAGYVCPEPRAEFFSAMDAANVDLKAFSEEFYRTVCGGALASVLETLVYLRHETSVWFELTTLLIPGENDSDGELDVMTRWVVDNLGTDVPMHFTAFHPDWKMRDHPPTPPETLARARRIALANGVRHAYTGNTHDAKGGSTWCPGCGSLLIERDWYRLGHWGLSDDGHCGTCNRRLEGRIDGPPGDWGARRTPIRLRDFAAEARPAPAIS